MHRTFAILALITLLATPCLADRDMTGGQFQILAPMLAFPNSVETFTFYVYNGSPDGERTEEVRFVFSDIFSILDGWYDDFGQDWSFDISYSGDNNNIIHFIDADGDPGEIEPGTWGHFHMLVNIPANTDCGEFTMTAKQYGELFENEGGTPPHWIREDLPYLLCSIPVEKTCWSTVKSLY